MDHGVITVLHGSDAVSRTSETSVEMLKSVRDGTTVNTDAILPISWEMHSVPTDIEEDW